MINIFNNIKLAKENKELKKKVKTLEQVIKNQDLRNDQLFRDYMRLLRSDTIEVSVDEENKIRELVKYSPFGFIIDKNAGDKE